MYIHRKCNEKDISNKAKKEAIMLLAQKLRIFPNPERESVLWDLSEKCRLIYNFGLQERIDHWRENKVKPKTEQQYITYLDQQNKLPLLKNKFQEYTWVYTKVLQMSLRKLDSDYKSFFAKWEIGDKAARPPKYKGRKYFTTLCYNQRGFRIKQNYITFSHNHPSKIPLIFRLKYPFHGTSKIKQVDIKRESNTIWFVCIIYEITVLKYRDNGLYQAIDLGINNLVLGVNLHFKFVQIKNRRADLYWKKKLVEVQSKRDHCKKNSNRWHRYNEKYIRMKRKCANQMRDYQHKISKRIVMNTKANTIITGNLKVKQMAKKKKGTGNAKKTKLNKTLNHSIHNTGSLGRFTQFLTYKAELLGKRIIRINESYTT